MAKAKTLKDMIGDICELMHALLKSQFGENGMSKDAYRVANDLSMIGRETKGGQDLSDWLTDPETRAEIW